ncbi:MAG: hypothetical protein ABF391_18375 [Akkermansiaceae bacterium]
MNDWTLEKLNEADRRQLARRLAQAQLGSRIYRRRVLKTTPWLIGIFCVWTLLASEVSALYIVIFWLGIGALISSWLYLESKSEEAKARSRIEGALTTNTVRRIGIKARRLWEIHSAEFGAIYLFENDQNSVTFLSSIDFHRTSSFPSLNFEYREILGPESEVIESRYQSASQKAEPERIITCGKLPDDISTSSVTFHRSSLDDLISQFELS